MAACDEQDSGRTSPSHSFVGISFKVITGDDTSVRSRARWPDCGKAVNKLLRNL